MGEARQTTSSFDGSRHRRGRTTATATFPVLAGLVVLVASDRIDLVLGGILGLGLVAIVARSPIPALLVFPALLPFQQVVLALLFNVGVPAGIVRGLGFWKEAVMAGLVVAAVSRARAEGGRVDGLDLAAACLVGNIVMYRLAPGVLAPSRAIPSSTSLNLALRGSTMFVVLFVAARRLDVSQEVRDRFARVVMASGGVIAAIGVVEGLFSTWWNTLAVKVIGIPAYRSQILDSVLVDPNDIRVRGSVGGQIVVRVGSVFFSQISCGLYLVVVLALALEHLARDRGPRWAGAIAPLAGVAIVLTQTRAAVLAAGVVVLFALRPAPGRTAKARERVGIAVGAALLLLVPVAVSTGLATRAFDTVGARDESTQVHSERTSSALRRLVEQPLGAGLGTTSEVSRRVGADVSGASENFYLDLGNETGVQSVLLFGVVTVLAVAALQRRTNQGDGQVLEAAFRGALISLSLAALLHPVWFDQILAWPIWLGAGLAVGSPRDPSAARTARYPDPPATLR